MNDTFSYAVFVETVTGREPELFIVLAPNSLEAADRAVIAYRDCFEIADSLLVQVVEARECQR